MSSAANSTLQRISPADYQTRFTGQAHALIDVRTREEFSGGHIPGATNIELDVLARRLGEVPKDQPVILYCRTGRRSAMAAQILARAGYTELFDLGGIVDWQRQGLPVQ